MTTPTPMQTAETALRTRVAAWATANLSTARMELPNQPIVSRPAPDPSNAAASTWIRLTIRNGDYQRLGLGVTARRRAIGVGFIDIFTPKGVGTGIGATHADSLLAYFRNQSDGAVVYDAEPSAIVPFAQEDDWFTTQVQVPFYVEFRPDEQIEQVVYNVITVTQAAHGFSVGDAVYQSGGVWAKAIATAEATIAQGIVVGVPDTATANISVGPVATVNAHGLGAGGVYLYLSQSVAGALTSAVPQTGIKQLVATVLDANRLVVHDLIVEAAA